MSVLLLNAWPTTAVILIFGGFGLGGVFLTYLSNRTCCRPSDDAPSREDVFVKDATRGKELP